MACRVEEVPDPGDFAEYEICNQSVLVVRQQDGSVRAFENACRHRATQLAVGDGRFSGGQIVCPFHGWRWNLDGTSSFVFHEEQFAPECVRPDDLQLRECLVETWGGCVWVNLDPRRSAPGRGVGARRRPSRRVGSPEHAGEVLEGGHPQRQLEDGPGGVLRGISRAANPSPALAGGRRGNHAGAVRGLREGPRAVRRRQRVRRHERGHLHRDDATAVGGAGRHDTRARGPAVRGAASQGGPR